MNRFFKRIGLALASVFLAHSSYATVSLVDIAQFSDSDGLNPNRILRTSTHPGPSSSMTFLSSPPLRVPAERAARRL